MIKKDRTLVKLSSSKLCIECCKPYKETPSVASGMCQKCYYMTRAEKIQLEKDELRKEQARLAAIDNFARQKAEEERRRIEEKEKKERIQKVADKIRKAYSPTYEARFGTINRPADSGGRFVYAIDFYGPILSGRKAKQRLRVAEIDSESVLLDERVNIKGPILTLEIRSQRKNRRFQALLRFKTNPENRLETVKFLNMLVLQDSRSAPFLLERLELLDFADDRTKEKAENFLRALI